MFKVNEKNALVDRGVYFVCFSMFIFFPFYGFHNIKLILASLLPLITFLFIDSSTLRSRIFPFTTYQKSFCIFILFSMLSLFWTSNFSESLNSVTNYILIFLFGIAFKVCMVQTNLTLFVKSMQILCLVLVLQNLYALILSDDKGIGWINLLSVNPNYTSSLMVMLCPWIICDVDLKSYLRIFLSVILLLILFFIGSRGSLIAFVFFVIMTQLKKLNLNYSFFLVLIFGLVFFYVFSKYFMYNSEIGRTYFLVNSIKLWRENPFVGTGIGTWNIEILKFGLNFNEDNLINVRNTIPVLSHNLYAKILVESGIVGLGINLYCILTVLISMLKLRKNWICFSAFCSLLIYVFFCNIYTFCILTKFDFSAHFMIFVILLMHPTESNVDHA